MIYCRECKIKKEAAEFQHSRLIRWVRKRCYPTCKECTNKQNRRWYEKNKDVRRLTTKLYKDKNKEKYRQYAKDYGIKNKEKMKEQRYKRHRTYEGYKKYLFISMQQRIKHHPNYKNRKVGFTREEFEYWLDRNHLDLYLKMWEATGYNRKYSPSIDRIDNNANYTLDNIQILPMCINARKYAVSEEGIANAIRKLEKIKANHKLREQIVC